MKTTSALSFRAPFLRRTSSALRLALAVFLSLADLSLSVRAAVPAVFEYQGRLADGSGVPRTGSFPLAFRIYNQSGTLQATYTPSASVTVTNGVFSVLVGDLTSGAVTAGASPDLSQALSGAGDRFLEIVVGGTPLSPRQRLISSPYALQVADGSVTDAKVVSGAAIAYSKLNLSGSVANGDLSTGAYPSITGLGTVTSGAWHGTLIDVAHGGTGASTANPARLNLGAAASTTTITTGTGLTVTGGGTLATDRNISLVGTGLVSCGTAATGKLYWDGTNGRLACGADNPGTGGTVTGSGTPNAIAKFNSSSGLTSSLLTDNGTSANVGGPASAGSGMAVTGSASVSGLLSGNSMSLTSPLTVANGGTGAATLTAGGVLLGNGTGAVTAMPVLTNGQLLIGDGSGAPAAATLTQTPNQLLVANGAGTITLSLPQNIGSGASPTFSGLSLTGTPLDVGSGGTETTSLAAHGVLVGNDANPVSVTAPGASGNVLLSGGTAADPAWGFITNANLAGGSYAAITGLGAVASGTWNGTTVDALHGGTGFTTAATGDLIYGSTATANAWDRRTIGSNGQILTVSGATPAPAWAAVPGVFGSGTGGKVPKWSAAASLTDSILSDNGTTVTVGGALSSHALTLTTTPLGIGSGGTGLSSLTANDYLRVNATATGFDQRTPVQARGDIGAAASGVNSDITTLSGLTTPLATLFGGTGQSAVGVGSILFGNGSVWGQRAIGTAGQVLTVSGGLPTWTTLPTPVSGSGVAGRAAFWNGTFTLTSDPSFVWDNVNKRLGVGPVAPVSAMEVTPSATDIGNGDIAYLDLNANSSPSMRSRILFNSTQGGDQGWEFGRDSSASGSDDLYFKDLNTNTFGAVFKNNGFVGIGTTAPETLLHVNGATEILASGPGAGFRFRERDGFLGAGDPTYDWIWAAAQDAGLHKAFLIAAHVNEGLNPSHPDALMEFASDNGGIAVAGPVTDARLSTYVSGAPSSIEADGAGGGLAAIINGNVTINGTWVLGGSSKTFIIPHPLHPDDKYLVHAVMEGPEAAVYYRGNARLVDGRTEVLLPSYFEALTRPEGRTVLVTPRFNDGDEAVSPLTAGRVTNGRFVVKAIDRRNPAQSFDWEVKAVRKDVAPLVVEPRKDAVEVAGDGPYTYIKGWKK